MSNRQFATIRTITAIHPIDGADNIEVAQVDGWTAVVGKGQHAAGDNVLFIEIDAAVPIDDPRFAFLAARKERVDPLTGARIHPVKTIKLRGVYSQGLVFDLAEFPELDSTPGACHDEQLGVYKWEPNQWVGYGATNVSKRVSDFPTYLGPKTDSLRVQNLGKHWDAISEMNFYATEKVDGTSLSVFRDPDGNPFICSRNFVLDPSESNVYVNAVTEFGVLDQLGAGQGIQGELYGPGIQGNPLGVREVRLCVFNFLHDHKFIPRQSWPYRLELWFRCHPGRVHPAPLLDVEFPWSVAEAIAQADGLKSTINPERQAEGIVWHRSDGRCDWRLDNLANFKAINRNYLLTHDQG